jgi:RimJ/RimL family protein N-acetyltransferase
MLHGEQVSLRALEREDLPALHELLDDDLELMARASDTPARPSSLAELEHRFEERLEESDPRTMRFVIEVDDELIGECELHFIDHFQRTCHLGITLGRAYWSKGFGQDAVRALVDFAWRCSPTTNGRSAPTRKQGSSRRAGSAPTPGSTVRSTTRS